MYMSFSQVKAIDILWQLLVGVGPRFLMSCLAFKVFSEGLIRLMEASPVLYELHVTLTFSTISIHISEIYEKTKSSCLHRSTHIPQRTIHHPSPPPPYCSRTQWLSPSRNLTTSALPSYRPLCLLSKTRKSPMNPPKPHTTRSSMGTNPVGQPRFSAC